MHEHHRNEHNRNGRNRNERRLTGLLTVALLAITLVVGDALVVTSPQPAVAAVDDHDWLGAVNSYRMMSGLGPVSENPTWSAEGREHSRYMLLNGITHVQDAAAPGASDGGALAGGHGNVAVSSDVNATPRRYVDLWMSGPFHAIGLLRENLTTTGFGLASDATTSPWRSGATLDVVRGITGAQPRTTAVVFPGRDATIAMGRFVAERPDPVELVGYSKPAGLPLLAMLPGEITTAAASLVGPAGPMEVRILHPGRSGGDATAQQLMEGDNAVVIVPRAPLEPGRYTASITSDGGDVTWSFTIDPAATLPTPSFPDASTGPAPTDGAPSTITPAPAGQPSVDTTTLSAPAGYVPLAPRRVADSRSGLGVLRLSAGQATTIDVGSAADVAASVNITVDRPSAPGFLSVHGASDAAPAVSTLNFTDRASANHVVAPLTDGRLTLSASVDTEVIVDLNGVFRTDSANRFVAVPPRRVVDSRIPGSVRLEPGTTQTVALVGVPGAAPAGAVAVAVNLTMIEPSGAGYLTARPSGSGDAGVSNVNVLAGETRPNSALLTPGPDGAVVLESTVSTHVVIDVTGYVIAAGDGSRFAPVEPIRLFDSRADGATGGVRIAGGTTVEVPVAGRRGVASDTRAVWLNVTAVDPSRPGYVTVHPGGATPTVSSLNTDPDRPAVANGVLVALRDGSISLYTDHDVHVMVDLTGVWS